MTIDRRPRDVWVLTLALTVAAGVVGYVPGFVAAYMMNDLPGGEDHRLFVGSGLLPGAVAVAVVAAMLRLRSRWRVWQSLAFPLGWAAAAHGAFLAWHFWFNMGSFADDSGTAYGMWSGAEVWGAVAVCAAISTAGAALAVSASRSVTGPE